MFKARSAVSRSFLWSNVSSFLLIRTPVIGRAGPDNPGESHHNMGSEKEDSRGDLRVSRLSWVNALTSHGGKILKKKKSLDLGPFCLNE